MNLARTLATWLVVCLSTAAASICVASQRNAKPTGKEVDVTFLRISPAELQERLKHARTELDFFQLIQRAKRNNLSATAIDTTKEIERLHPGDALYLGAYACALDAGARNRADYQHAYEDTMHKALKLGGPYWLPLILEGRSEVVWGYRYHQAPTVVNHQLVPDPQVQAHGLSLLKKAVRIAPNISITHEYLAEAYQRLAPWNKDHYELAYIRLALTELAAARSMEPATYAVPMDQLWIDLSALKSQEKARHDKREILSLIPSESMLNDGEKLLMSEVKEQ